MSDRIGFMQGRLSPLVHGRIQAFPWSCWQAEFEIAERHGFRLMEWTLDQERLRENPLLTAAGQIEIAELCRRHKLAIPSVTGDCFMQAPFWKAEGRGQEDLQLDFAAVASACVAVGASTIVVPLVDNGRIEDVRQEDALVSFLKDQTEVLAGQGLRVIFESDFGPADLGRFIARLDRTVFGINYDMGNSAALGLRLADEFAAYGHRIGGVHVKDRMLGGGTVPLGTGVVDFEAVFAALARIGYRGNYILQTARASDDDHRDVLCRYRDMTADLVKRHAA